MQFAGAHAVRQGNHTYDDLAWILKRAMDFSFLDHCSVARDVLVHHC